MESSGLATTRPPAVQREGTHHAWNRARLTVAAYVASAALAISGTVLAVTPAEAARRTTRSGNQGATWLAGSSTNGSGAQRPVRRLRRRRPDASTRPSPSTRSAGTTPRSTTIADAIAARGATSSEYTEHVRTTCDHLRRRRPPRRWPSPSRPARRRAPLSAASNLIAELEDRPLDAGADRRPDRGRRHDGSLTATTPTRSGRPSPPTPSTTAGSAKAARRRLPAQAAVPRRRLPAATSPPTRRAAVQSCADGTRRPTPTPPRSRATSSASPSRHRHRDRCHRPAPRRWLARAAEVRRLVGWRHQHRGLQRQQHRPGGQALGDTAPSSREGRRWLRARQATRLRRLRPPRPPSAVPIAYDDAALATGRTDGITGADAATSGAGPPPRRCPAWPTCRSTPPRPPRR